MSRLSPRKFSHALCDARPCAPARASEICASNEGKTTSMQDKAKEIAHASHNAQEHVAKIDHGQVPEHINMRTFCHLHPGVLIWRRVLPSPYQHGWRRSPGDIPVRDRLQRISRCMRKPHRSSQIDNDTARQYLYGRQVGHNMHQPGCTRHGHTSFTCLHDTGSPEHGLRDH